MRILLTGGSGRLAPFVLGRPATARFLWRLASRRAVGGPREHARVDLVSGEGLDAALDGVDAVLHLASNVQHPDDDVRMAEQLVAACGRHGVGHLCFISIVGIDRIPLPYYRAKLAAEQVIASGAAPWTIVRVAQFHSFVDLLLRQLARVPLVMPIPAGFRVQSIADEEVAEHLLDLLAQGPSGRVPDVCGPDAMTFRDAAAAWCAARGVRRTVLPLPIPGAVARGFRTGANTSPEAPGGRERWQEWLARTAASS
ncbi:MAG TPA: NAD(P)H-binding protein [Gemmatimonadales bacterium]|nr:NAD(P)H-binding protein [Gemmatimonadales bacterium]